jgi:CRP-like cAMP-binding protein
MKWKSPHQVRHQATESSERSRLISREISLPHLLELSTKNVLLRSLTSTSFESLQPKLEYVELPLRQIIYAPHEPIHHVYFPIAGAISLVTTLSNGTQSEVGITGREGMHGISLLSGFDHPFCDAIVQMPGFGLRMAKRDFRSQIESNLPLRNVLLRYNEALKCQIMQTATCNVHHGLEQRLGRWLLMAHDRADGDVIQITQTFIAMMLGAHRPSVTNTAAILQKAGAIQYTNSGRITILDRAKLESLACECHGAIKRRYCELLGPLEVEIA